MVLLIQEPFTKEARAEPHRQQEELGAGASVKFLMQDFTMVEITE